MRRDAFATTRQTVLRSTNKAYHVTGVRRSLKASEYFIPTLREVPAEAEIASHQLLLRAGYIRKLSAGVYTFLPLAWRVIRKIEQVIRDEMDAIACLEMRMPSLHPREMMEETGRWNVDVVYN